MVTFRGKRLHSFADGDADAVVSAIEKQVEVGLQCRRTRARAWLCDPCEGLGACTYACAFLGFICQFGCFGINFSVRRAVVAGSGSHTRGGGGGPGRCQ